MKKLLVIIGIVTILVFIGLSGCNSTEQTNEQEQNNEQPVTEQQKIIGTWWNETYDGDELTYIFFNNGSVYQTWNANTHWYDYSITEDTLIIGNDVYEFTFSDDNQKLILNGDVFERQ
jgi:hypothetical protein